MLPLLTPRKSLGRSGPPSRFPHLENGANKNNRSYPPAPTELPCGSPVCPGLGTGPAQRTAAQTPAQLPPAPLRFPQRSLVLRARRNVGRTDLESAADGIRRGASGPHALVVTVTTAQPPGRAQSLPWRDGQVQPALALGESSPPQHLASSGRKQTQPVIRLPEPPRPGRPPAAHGLTLLEVLLVVPRLVLLHLELLHQVFRQHLGRFSRGQRPRPPPSLLSHCPGRSAGPSALRQSSPRTGPSAASPVQSRLPALLVPPNGLTAGNPGRLPEPAPGVGSSSRSPAQRGTSAKPSPTRPAIQTPGDPLANREPAAGRAAARSSNRISVQGRVPPSLKDKQPMETLEEIKKAGKSEG